MTTIAVIDVETDRFDQEEGDAKIIELACVAITHEWDVAEDCGWEEEFSGSWLFCGGPITPRARAIHHIADSDVAQYNEFSAPDWIKLVADEDVDYYAAHNMTFDRAQIERAVGPTEKPWICTLKCARVAWPDAPAFGNQVLRYWRGIEKVVEPADLYPHRALYDAQVTSWLLIDLIAAFDGDLERMVKVSSEPSLLQKITFGKHRGKLWSEVPRDYLSWVLKQDFDEDVQLTARRWLER